MIKENEFALPIKYLPRVSWFANAIEKRELILCSAEIYRRENHPNRCSIVSANGLINLSVPLAGGRNQKVMMSELKIAGNDWKRNHLQAIKSAYGKAPYFLYYFDALENCIKNSEDNYLNFCIELIKWLIHELIRPLSINVTSAEIPVLNSPSLNCKKYYQVFENKFGFQNDVCAIDLLFCMGPDANQYLIDNFKK